MAGDGDPEIGIVPADLIDASPRDTAHAARSRRTVTPARSRAQAIHQAGERNAFADVRRAAEPRNGALEADRKSTRLNSSHG